MFTAAKSLRGINQVFQGKLIRSFIIIIVSSGVLILLIIVFN